jgi:hypothetical protein
MATIIDAIVTKGFGVASKNIKFQLPPLTQQFPNIKDIHPGSINVRLQRPLHTPRYDYTTSPIQWWDAGPDRWQTEIFSFLEIKFEYPLGNRALYRAWFFDCHNSAYHENPYCHEIISQMIDGVSYNQPCRIHLPSELFPAV